MSLVAIALSALLLGAAPSRDEDAFRDFAHAVEAGINEGHAEALTVDVIALFRRVTADIPTSDEFKAGFVRGMKKAGGDKSVSQKFGEQLVSSVREGGSLKLLRLHSVNGETHALYRLVSGKQALNYIDLHLERSAPGPVRVSDLYLYLLGETFGDSLRRLYLLGAASAQATYLDRLMGKEQTLVKFAGAFKEVQQLQQEGKHAEVVAAVAKLPPEVRKEKYFLLIRVSEAQALGDEAQYRRAIEAYEAALPDDPSLDLISVDGEFLRKQYDRALNRIDRLDRRVHDPYLEFLRGSILFAKGDERGAGQHYRAAVQAEPTLSQPYFGILTLALKQKDFKLTAETLTALQKNTPVVLKNLETVPAYAEFVRSKEYRSWKK